jgi:WD40 repeat protein
MYSYLSDSTLGLRTFQPEDAELFFGRAAKIQELVDRLRNNFATQQEERFLALIGASGSGKSSLALAGLIAAVRSGALPRSTEWPLVRCRPGVRPWESLQIAFANNRQIASHLVALPALITRPEDDQRCLHLIASLILHDQSEKHRLFVLIDQFEEIFTSCNDEEQRCRLIDNILYATNVTGGRAIVVLTMRADFYAQCLTYPGLRAAISDHQVLIGPLSDEEIREVIQMPAQLAGGELEPGLIELLLTDMKGRVGALPFLEHALLKLWGRRDGRQLTAKAYTDMGRLEGTLDAHAEEFFTKTLTPQEQTLCRRILVDLVHPGEGVADTKKRVPLDDVAPTEDARAVLKKLTDARLVTTDRDRGPEGAQAELAHEALIAGWHRLGSWVNENREKSRLKERLLESAREWQKNDKREDFLYRGAQLALAEETFDLANEPLTKLGREFLEVSIAEECRERNERQLQQDRERASLATAAQKEVARRIAEEARAAEAEKRRQEQKALRYFAWGLTAVALIAAAAAIFGFLQKGEADRQKELAIVAEQTAKKQKEEADRQEELAIVAEETAKKQKEEAEKQASLAIEQATLARAAEKRTSEISSRLNVFLARYSHKSENNAQTLALLAQALRQNPKNFEAGALTLAILGQIGWHSSLICPLWQCSCVVSAHFDPGGQRVVTTSWSGEARVRDARTGTAISEPMKQGGSVYIAQFSPDGKRVVTASLDGTAQVWDAQTARPIGEPMTHAQSVSSVQFSPDGQRVVTASVDGTAQVWDAQTGRPIGKSMRHEKSVNAAWFSPNGQWVVTASEDGTARVWDQATGNAIGEAMRHEKPVLSARFSPDGKSVVTASLDGTARVWDATTGKPIGAPIKHERGVNSAQFSPEGQRVVTASVDGTTRVWDAETGKPIGAPMKHEDSIKSAEFSADGQRVSTASMDGTAKVWDAATGDAICEPMRFDGGVVSAEFSPDGQLLMATSLYGTVRVWDTFPREFIQEHMNHQDAVVSAQFSPDGQRVATASTDGTARVWNASTLKAVGEPMKHQGPVVSAGFSPDGKWVVTASDDGTAQVWNASTGKAVGEPMKHQGPVVSARFSPDGKWVVTASDDGTAQVWDAHTGNRVGKPMKHEGGVDSVDSNADSRQVVTASKDGTARVWDAATGKAIGQAMQHEGAINSAQFSPDGRQVVTASKNGTARLWDAATSREIGEPMRHDGGVNSAQFSPGGERVVTASMDKTVRLWNATTGKPLGNTLRHEDAVGWARFQSGWATDSHRLARRDGTAVGCCDGARNR